MDRAPQYFELWLDAERPERLPSKWIELSAKTEEEAKAEAHELDRKLDAEFFAKRDIAGVPFKRDPHYRNWVQAHGELRRAVRTLAKMRATTTEGLQAKALVAAVADSAFDDPDIWNEPLRKSIMRDLQQIN